MDDLEKKLYHDLSSGIDVPDKIKTIIEESLKDTNIKKKKYPFLKVALATCACLILTVGIVYAGTKVYDAIWKEPEKVVGPEDNVNEKDIMNNNTMTEEEGREKGIEEKARETVRNLSAMGLSADKIASAVQVSIEEVREWLSDGAKAAR